MSTDPTVSTRKSQVDLLAAQINQGRDQLSSVLRIAEITAVGTAADGGIITARMGGSSQVIENIRTLDHVMPVVGKIAVLQQQGPDLFCIGQFGTVGPALPPGIIAMYGGLTIPTGWLLCNGQSASAYPALAAVLPGGMTPNLVDRFIVGAGGGYSLGNTGGVTTNTAVPAHTHLQGAHQHSIGNVLYNNDSGFHNHSNHPGALAEGPEPWSGYSNPLPKTNTDGGGTTGSTGSATVENRPPYYALYYIIKT